MAKILVVDDDPDFLEATRMVLEPAGHEVITATDGDEGLERSRAKEPDLVILDVIMSTVLDGLNMSQRMSQDPDQADIPILMVTSIANSDYRELFPTDEYIHIDDFVSKPIAPDDLLNRVERLLKRGQGA
ncbi:MAG: response regulator [Anaerolineae bacterium]|nr:response regulator [Anaerolineae bacterium]